MKIVLSSVIILFFCFVFTSSSFSQRSYKVKAKQIDKLVSKYVELKEFSGDILVAEKGKILFLKSYGMSDFEKSLLNNTDTHFDLGSITKQFTSMLIMQLVQKGKIRLDGNISDYLPYFRKDTGEKVTIQNLLTHTSGIPNFFENKDFLENQVEKPAEVKEFVLKYCSGDLEFEPGTRFNYSNSGYFILGAIIEEVSGKKFNSALKENILVPLGMNETGFEDKLPLQNFATGYNSTPEGIKPSRYIDLTTIYTAGGMYSTVKDLYKWDRALYSHKLLSDTLKEKMFTPVLNNYGYGWYVEKINVNSREKNVLYHGGRLFGFNTDIMRIPEDDKVIIALSNFGNGQSTAICEDIAKILYELPWEMPKRSLGEIFKFTYRNKGSEQAFKEFRVLINKKDEYELKEGDLNGFGYQLMQMNKMAEAIGIFKLNVEMFPDSPNVYDSLGESYLNNGDKEQAIRNYKKVLELQPGNENAINVLKKLESN